MVTWHDPAGPYHLVDITFFAEDISFTLDEYVASRTLGVDNFLVMIDCSAGDITITLPESASHNDRVYTIKKIDSSNHKVTIDANSTETIDGEETIDLNLQYQYLTIVCDGTEWFIIGGEYVKMEDILEDIRDRLDTLLDQDAKGLVLQLENLKAQTDEEFEEEQMEEELREMVVDVNE